MEHQMEIIIRDQNEKLAVPVEIPTKESFEPYGTLINDTVHNPGLSIPFYQTVQEGHNFDDIEFNGAVTGRTARIHPRPPKKCCGGADRDVMWLERHMNMTQIFIGIGTTPFLMVMGVPTQDRWDLDDEGRALPDMSNVKAFVMPPGQGCIIHKGTWHDFPVAIEDPVTVLTFNSPEVVEALSQMKKPAPMNFGDVYKLRLSDHFEQNIVFSDPRPLARQFAPRTYAHTMDEMNDITNFNEY